MRFSIWRMNEKRTVDKVEGKQLNLDAGCTMEKHSSMPKVGIITFHFANNFGGVLQTYAISSFIKREYKAEVTVIDYRNPFIVFCDMVRLLPISINIREIAAGFAAIKQKLKGIKKLRAFVKAEMNLSKKYLTYAELRKDPPGCTHFIAGSDQIWNPVITLGIDKPYYLGFAKGESKKISYAASLGRGGGAAPVCCSKKKNPKISVPFSCCFCEGRSVQAGSGKDNRKKGGEAD